jgi:hypothetical protein
VLTATLLAALAAAAPAAAVEIVIASDSPLRGEPVAVTVTDGGAPVAGARVEAHYRPNSQTASREELAPTGADGRTEWTPHLAGIVTLAVLDPEGGAPPASVNTAVRMGYFPASGIAVMVIAGLLLFGGAAIGMTMLLREGPPAVEPPST